MEIQKERSQNFETLSASTEMKFELWKSNDKLIKDYYCKYLLLGTVRQKEIPATTVGRPMDQRVIVVEIFTILVETSTVIAITYSDLVFSEVTQICSKESNRACVNWIFGNNG